MAIVVEQQKQIKIRITMDVEEAKWLLDMLQNPIIEVEDEKDHKIRTDLFQALKPRLD